MANSLRPIAITILPASGLVPIYFTPHITTFTVSMIHISNVSSSGVNTRICLVPSGSAAAIGNALIWDISVPANDFIEFGKGDIYAAGYSLHGKASADNSINIKVAGIETT